MNVDLSWLNHDSIIEIIETASQLILQVYIGDDFYVNYKDDQSPLTLADRKANDHICSQLKILYPWIPIISEENKNEDYEERKKYSFVWLIDPLDGTKEFIRKNGEFTCNIGLAYMGKPVAGFVTIPVKGLTYWSVQGRGAWRREIGKNWISLGEIREGFSLKNEGRSRKGLRVISSRSHLNQETVEFINTLGDCELVNVGSSIKILWIAENLADVYPRMTGCMEWDTCATHAILNEVGGKIWKYPELNEELVYNKESLLNSHFVCKFNEVITP